MAKSDKNRETFAGHGVQQALWAQSSCFGFVSPCGQLTKVTPTVMQLRAE